MKTIYHHNKDSEHNDYSKSSLLIITVAEDGKKKKVSYTKNQEIIDDLINNLSDIAAFSYNIREYTLPEIVDTLNHTIILIKSIPKKLYKDITSELESIIYEDEDQEEEENEKIMDIYELLEEYEVDITNKKEYLEFLKDCIAEWKIGRMSDKRKNTPTSS